MNTSISTADLSVRTKNLLHEAGIHTIEQLKATPFEQLKRIRHLGKRTLTEIEDFFYNEDFLQDDEDRQPLMASQATLRDYFAAKALQGWLAMYASDTRHGAPPPESAATIAYAYADGMLKAREQ